MKKAFGVLLVLLLFVSVVVAQESDKSDKRAKREARKEAQKREDALLAEEVLQAIDDKQFVLVADKVSFSNGATFLTNPRLNFIILNGDKATVQLGSTGFQRMGPNGLGGITVEGRPTNMSTTTDKRGNLYLSMSVQGIAISAQVTITVPKNSNRGIAIVAPNFNSYRITMKGLIYPLNKQDIFEGRAL